MKTLLATILAVLLCGSAFAGEKIFPDTLAGELSFTGGYPGYDAKVVESFVEYMRPPTYRRLLEAYAGKAPDSRFAPYAAREIATNKKKGAAIVAGFEQLAADAVKAKDSRASIYRRAAEKLAQQVKEKSIRLDAQTAVADALKALEVKS
jgi:hypothetical protein